MDGQAYRWLFFENDGWNDVTIQCASGTGPKLVVQFPWHHEGHPDSLPVTPSVVEAIIKEAGTRGWEPEGSGTTIRMKWEEETLSPVSMSE